MTDRAVATFKATFGGSAIMPDEEGYDDARAAWNGFLDRRPAVVARCGTTEDAVAVVNFARETGLPLAVRGGGHSVPGFSTCDGGIVLDLSPMREVTVDSQTRVARAQGGATWADYDEATQARGLASTGGLISTTGVAGLALGGGIGWLQRKQGLACDNLIAAEVVTAGGEVVRASTSRETELLWGLRGGGGNFGVVTNFEFRLHPVDLVLGGLAMFPLGRGVQVLRAYRSWAAELPDEFTTLAAVLTAPPAPFVPDDLVGRKAVAVLGCWCGDLDAGEAALAPIRALEPAADAFGPMPYAVLQGMLDEGAPRHLRNYFRSGYTAEISDGAIDVVLAHGEEMPSPLSQIHFHQMGGAVARVGEGDTAFGNRHAAFAYNLISTWEEPSEDDVHLAANRDLAAALQPFSTGGVYVNFLGDEGEARIKAAYGQEKYERLARLKRVYDPQNLFRLNQNIVPAP